MRTLCAALAATTLAACASTTGAPVPSDPPAALAAAETAFAAQSVREGVRAAFLAWFAPDSLLFRPGPVNAPAHLAANPDPPVVLDWRPAYVEVAASGELGLSTGPWTLASRKDPSAPRRHGQFISVWKRSGGGPWRVLVDLGISHPGAALAEAPLQVLTTAPGDPSPAGTLAEAEARFAGQAAQAGDRAAYARLASPTLRLYRDGHAPFLGREAALASPAARESRTTWTLDANETSAAGDFGYAIGRFGPGAGAIAGHFVRVWRREAGGWRIALDVVSEVPPR